MTSFSCFRWDLLYLVELPANRKKPNEFQLLFKTYNFINILKLNSVKNASTETWQISMEAPLNVMIFTISHVVVQYTTYF